LKKSEDKPFKKAKIHESFYSLSSIKEIFMIKVIFFGTSWSSFDERIRGSLFGTWEVGG